MRSLHNYILLSALLIGLHFVLTGCVVRSRVDDGVYYDGSDRGPWFRDDPWMDGRGWYRDRGRADVEVYVYPHR